MAERRMFSKAIIDSDAFLDMPLSTQALYFHLSMRADDDGFIDNPRKIQRSIGCGFDDLKLLIAKQYVIPFDSGVLVIKHWKLHNYIQKDRYKPTMYQNEKSQLDFKTNKVYTLKNPETVEKPPMDTKCIQDVSNLDTQDRLGKVRLDKDRLGKVSIEGGMGGDPQEPAPPLPPPPAEDEEEEPPSPKNDCQQVVDLYNSICKSLPSVREVSEARKRTIKARVKKYGIDKIRTVFETAEASAFLRGETKDWKANFDWLMKEANMVKVLEGNYADSTYSKGRKEMIPDWMNKPSQRAIEDVHRMVEEETKRAGNDPDLAARVDKLKEKLQGGNDQSTPDSA